jgi:hypothetical protein
MPEADIELRHNLSLQSAGINRPFSSLFAQPIVAANGWADSGEQQSDAKNTLVIRAADLVRSGSTSGGRNAT